MEYRIERDSMGEVRVPAHRRWGAQTQRSLEHFSIGTERMPQELHEALVQIKRAAAVVNTRMGRLDETRAKAITQAADEALQGHFNSDFVLPVWQTGSGTQTNMNVNEVLAFRANEILSESQEEKTVTVHPGEHVNLSQSSNDVFSSAMHIAASCAVEDLLSALDDIRAALFERSQAFMDLVKTGRTHLQDSVPLTLGQEISGWAALLERDGEMIRASLPFLNALALGGTAVGTGLGAPENFDVEMAEELSRALGLSFHPAQNKFQALSGKDEMSFAHGALRTLAMDMLKIANDVRLLASGPRCGLGELLLPENEPGSSLLPGEVPPSQCEAVAMVAAQVLGNDTTIAFAAGQGSLELNVYMPVMIHNFLQSCRLLKDAMNSFEAHCISELEANGARLKNNAEISLMNVSALIPVIGCSRASQAAHKALAEGLTLKEAVLSLGWLGEAAYDRAMNLRKMCFPHGEESGEQNG